MQYAKPVTLNVEECDRLSLRIFMKGDHSITSIEIG
ncbi:antirestriction protein [Escherichia coli]|nr:antirestriction protein [Escherichia coli]GCK27308.1 antirestriction protein [Escherichia coli]GCL00834.1 antirestriction protein [Escherichia coli]GCL10447.1 antirestriction protein [Escherichia coli]